MVSFTYTYMTLLRLIFSFSLLFYSGNCTQGNIHLQAMVQSNVLQKTKGGGLRILSAHIYNSLSCLFGFKRPHLLNFSIIVELKIMLSGSFTRENSRKERTETDLLNFHSQWKLLSSATTSSINQLKRTFAMSLTTCSESCKEYPFLHPDSHVPFAIPLLHISLFNTA